ncbi:MAG: hypothetical protein ACYC99_07575 [Candidatus Geothermincolia bacterium]
MNRFLTRQLSELMPVFVGDPPCFADYDMEAQTQFIDGFMKAGAVEFKLIFFICAFVFKLLASLMKTKRWSRLSVDDRQAVANRLFESRSVLLRNIAVVCGLPLHISYYNRDEVHRSLGFDTEALKTEANLRSVSRDRGPASR